MNLKMNSKIATVYRMETPEHTCPYGIKALYFLKKNGYSVVDQKLTSRKEADEFKEEHDVKTTPQIFINDERIGGYSDLRAHLGADLQSEQTTSYKPVLAIFAVSFLTAVAVYLSTGSLSGLGIIGDFVALSMIILAVQKLQDVESFSTMFVNYDVLAKRWVPYSYIYPYAEALAGILMLSGMFSFVSIPTALFIGSVGAYSVFKAVYIDKREIKCACVGGNSNVPLGFVSLSENLAMIGMSLAMLMAALI